MLFIYHSKSSSHLNKYPAMKTASRDASGDIYNISTELPSIKYIKGAHLIKVSVSLSFM